MDAARMDREQYVYLQAYISLQPVALEVVDSYRTTAADKEITLAVAPPGELQPIVRGDKERLASAISVLVENAIAYSPKGGTVRVALTAAPDQVRFEIRDNGIGVSDEEKRHIFKKFYRTERARHADTEGIGLGLNMAKSIIERHRGTIGVESAGVGKGSTFWFTLPAPRVQDSHLPTTP
jgi:signal transduction histidine kinase